MAIGTPVAGTNLVVSVAATTWNVPHPASPAANDLLILRLTMNVTTAVSTPAGWTVQASPQASGSTSPRTWVFTKFATGSESGNLAVTVPSSTGQARMFKVSGVDTTTPMDVAPTTVSLGATTAYSIPSLTTVSAGALLFGSVSANASAGTFTPPTIQGGFTELTDVNTVLHSSDAWALMGAAGASGIANFVRSGSVRGSGALLALRPAAPAVDQSGWGIIL